MHGLHELFLIVRERILRKVFDHTGSWNGGSSLCVATVVDGGGGAHGAESL
jgi:hypothetical protein